jgi:serine/threonine-protein kinase
VLYEMLVGEPPYTGSTARAVFGKLISSEPEPMTSQRRAVPKHVDAAVAKALEKLSADRFTTASDFARALKNEHFRHGPAGAGAERSTVPRAWAVAGWVAAALLGASLAFALLVPDPAPPVRSFSLAYPEGYGPNEWLALTPDGSALILGNAPRGTGIRPTLVVHRMDDPVQIPLSGSEGGWDPVVSPDGEWVAWGTRNGLFAAPVAGGSVRTLFEGGLTWGPRWGGDGHIYYAFAPDFGAVSTSLYRVRATGGEPELVLEPAADSAESFRFYQPLPGGDRAVVQVEVVGQPARIEIVEVVSGRRQILTNGVRPFVTRSGHLVFARERGVFAALLDAGSMQLVAEPVHLVEGVGVVPDGTDAMFTLSDSGDLAYWVPPEEARDVQELVWVDRAGEANAVDPTWREQFESVSLSPSGTRAAVAIGAVGDTEIWVKELDDGPARRLTNYQGMNRRPIWAPDGSALAFISDRGESRAVYTVPVDGISTPELLLEHPGEDVDEVLWSSDGNWLVYRTGTTLNGRDIYARRLRPDTATIAVSARPGIDERAPALSPDGRWLAYVSNETGDEEVWVRPFPDVDRGSRQVSVGGGVEPAWSDRGNELFFRGGRMNSVVVGNGADFFTGQASVLFGTRPYARQTAHRAYDLDADGDRFLMIRTARREATRAQLTLVQNFIEEVKARVGN